MLTWYIYNVRQQFQPVPRLAAAPGNKMVPIIKNRGKIPK